MATKIQMMQEIEILQNCNKQLRNEVNLKGLEINKWLRRNEELDAEKEQLLSLAKKHEYHITQLMDRLNESKQFSLEVKQLTHDNVILKMEKAALRRVVMALIGEQNGS